MLTEVKAGVRIFCVCDRCRREIIYAIPLIEIDTLDDFRQNVIDTMNAEGWFIRDDYICVCPECNK